ncbi:MAG: hypothetical protein RBU30_08745 [Polyangia bacterium]|jgi:hypothetical protein|nr:hypothetical protein [Polyangia bacterium]
MAELELHRGFKVEEEWSGGAKEILLNWRFLFDEDSGKLIREEWREYDNARSTSPNKIYDERRFEITEDQLSDEARQELDKLRP